MANPHETPRSSANSSTSSLEKESETPHDSALRQYTSIYRSQTQRTSRSAAARKPEDIDGVELVNLPSRTLRDDANLDEYLEETVSGVIAEQRVSKGGRIEDYELVTWTIDDPENPKNWHKAFKW